MGRRRRDRLIREQRGAMLPFNNAAFIYLKSMLANAYIIMLGAISGTSLLNFKIKYFCSQIHNIRV